MALADQYNLSTDVAFQQRVEAALVTTAVSIANEVLSEAQTIATTGNPTGGTFTLSFGGNTTAALAFNATGSAIASALQALASIGTGNVVCTGGPLPTGVLVTFAGTLANTPLNLMTHTDSLTGGASPAVTVTRTTTGVAVVSHTARAALASKVLNNPSGYTVLLSVGVASNATVITDYTGGGNSQASVTDTHINNAISAMWNAYL